MPVAFVLALALVWIFWAPVCVWERAARGDPGGVSLFPALPLLPLAAWGIAALLERLRPGLGVAIVGGGHALLLLALVRSAIRSRRVLRRRRGAVDAAADPSGPPDRR